MIETPRSSCIRAMGYDEGTKVLEILFKQGGRYQFMNVPKNVYEECIKAPSVGKYFHSRIEGHYSYHKVL